MTAEEHMALDKEIESVARLMCEAIGREADQWVYAERRLTVSPHEEWPPAQAPMVTSHPPQGHFPPDGSPPYMVWQPHQHQHIIDPYLTRQCLLWQTFRCAAALQILSWRALNRHTFGPPIPLQGP